MSRFYTTIANNYCPSHTLYFYIFFAVSFFGVTDEYQTQHQYNTIPLTTPILDTNARLLYTFLTSIILKTYY